MSDVTLLSIHAILGQVMGQIPTTDSPQWQLIWSWTWPLWATLAAVVATTVWVVAIYSRESSRARPGMRAFLSLLRLTALGLALVMFAKPTLQWFRVGQPRMIVLVDRSESMATRDHYTGQTDDTERINAWQSWLAGGDLPLIDHWKSEYQLDVVVFDEQIRPLNGNDGPLVEQLNLLSVADNQTSGTRLGDAIDYALRELPGQPPVALVVATDGIVTRGQSLQQAAERARQLRVPLYTVAVGSDRVRPDIAVENLLVEELVFPGDRLQVEASLRGKGLEEKSATVLLRNTETGEVLAQTTIELPADESYTTVRLAIRPSEPGPLPLELSIEPLPNETNTQNNAARQVVDVRDEKIGVLLVQAQPSYEFRALKSLLERDPAVELRVWLQEADADYPEVDDSALRTFPNDEQSLFGYDVLILGDADLAMLPRTIWPLLERFVTDHGGGLVAIAGPQYMPLAYRDNQTMGLLLPLHLASLNPLRSQLDGTNTFSIYPTTLGWQTPSLQLGETRDESEQIWQSLPPVTWLLRVDDVKPGAQVLAEHPGMRNRQGQGLPVIMRQYVGAGEVLFHATDETWRWRWRTDDRYFARYWGQVVRRLGRGRLAAGRQGVQLSADRARYQPGETVQLQVRFRNPSDAPAANDQVIVQLRGEQGPPLQVSLHRRLGRRGVFAVQVDNLPPGKYEAVVVSPSLNGPADVAHFEIQQPPRELAELVVNRQGLQQAAKTSGGRYYSIENAKQLADELPAPRQQLLDARPSRPLWNSHWMIALFVLVLCSEWLLRRRHGML